MASFESIQRRIDARFIQAQKNLHEIALNNQGGPEDMARFLDASVPVHRLIIEKEWLCYVLKKEAGRP